MRHVFTFKAEAIWLLVLTLVPAAIALFFVLVLPWLRRVLGW